MQMDVGAPTPKPINDDSSSNRQWFGMQHLLCNLLGVTCIDFEDEIFFLGGEYVTAARNSMMEFLLSLGTVVNPIWLESN